VKQPGQFRALFAAHPQINEELGYQVARWAAGHDIEIRPANSATAAASSSQPATTPHPLAARLDACRSRSELGEIETDIRAAWSTLSLDARKAIEAAGVRAHARARAAAAAAGAGKEGSTTD
jgi:hypothetical protein